jgi:hypothetical protein
MLNDEYCMRVLNTKVIEELRTLKEWDEQNEHLKRLRDRMKKINKIIEKCSRV